ncbi:uncharacterized protein LY79DRAFT_672640 [Colletotrichum navitas]|uniref:Phage tail collar domain-containing protein n=1 Tax=Colletotrichum navitas TaxID=681940 RepID=A0AAD8PRD4_9PEZI|nr:uncharacterized protein LY79DRAFT_672640 [Colletotrichum navitas]KAK1579236.1 hypothetical protein LY79DRAFT_672640 [Colletotrichum navitas]
MPITLSNSVDTHDQVVSLPKNWVVCDGTSYPVKGYDDLFKAIGNASGGENGRLKIPDLQGRFIRGAVRARLYAPLFAAIGTTCGYEDDQSFFVSNFSGQYPRGAGINNRREDGDPDRNSRHSRNLNGTRKGAESYQGYATGIPKSTPHLEID